MTSAIVVRLPVLRKISFALNQIGQVAAPDPLHDKGVIFFQQVNQVDDVGVFTQPSQRALFGFKEAAGFGVGLVGGPLFV